jgi:hypothetical protein
MNIYIKIVLLVIVILYICNSLKKNAVIENWSAHKSIIDFGRNNTTVNKSLRYVEDAHDSFWNSVLGDTKIIPF